MKLHFFLSIILLISTIARAQQSSVPSLTVGVYQFRGEVAKRFDIGKEIAEIFSFDVWGWFRQRDDEGRYRPEFGAARINRMFNTRLPPDENLVEAIRSDAKIIEKRVDVLIWGDIHEIVDDEVLGSANLQFIRRLGSNLHFTWSVPTSRNGKLIRVEAEFPQLYYHFSVIKFSQKFVKSYKDTGVVVTMGKGSGKVIENFGPAYREYREGDYERVYNDRGVKGWRYTPVITENPPGIGEFTGGVIRLLRSDWQGAIATLQGMLSEQNLDGDRKLVLPAEVQIDATLHIIRAKSELGLDASPEIGRALKLAPLSTSVIKYTAMHYIARCFSARASLRRSGCSEDDRERLRKLISISQPLFNADDDWYKAAQAAVM